MFILFCYSGIIVDNLQVYKWHARQWSFDGSCWDFVFLWKQEHSWMTSSMSFMVYVLQSSGMIIPWIVNIQGLRKICQLSSNACWMICNLLEVFSIIKIYILFYKDVFLTICWKISKIWLYFSNNCRIS